MIVLLNQIAPGLKKVLLRLSSKQLGGECRRSYWHNTARRRLQLASDSNGDSNKWWQTREFCLRRRVGGKGARRANSPLHWSRAI